MKWTRTTAALIAVFSMAAAAVPAQAASECKKKCDSQAQACSRGKTDTTPCNRAWLQCKKACTPAASPPPKK